MLYETELVKIDVKVLSLTRTCPSPVKCVDVVAWVAPCNMVIDVKSNSGGLTHPTCHCTYGLLLELACHSLTIWMNSRKVCSSNRV